MVSEEPPIRRISLQTRRIGAPQGVRSRHAPEHDPEDISMSTASPSAPSVPFDLATVSGGGRRSATALDLDTMAAIAEKAGRDAVGTPGGHAPFDARSALRAMPTSDDMLVTATRLYRACRRGATDPATD